MPQQRVIYPTDTGISVLVPTGEIPVEQVARKDVPAGLPYLIIEVSDIPDDRSQRELWTADFGHPGGHGIGAEAWFAEQEAGQ
jgi:hypothetical protein